jgi:hypothetical protein
LIHGGSLGPIAAYQETRVPAATMRHLDVSPSRVAGIDRGPLNFLAVDQRAARCVELEGSSMNESVRLAIAFVLALAVLALFNALVETLN